MPLNPGDTLSSDHYRIERLLGRGGFGFVYLAQDTLLYEDVAIKELIPALVGDEAMLRRFLAEARATMRLRHKRIVATHNVFSEGGNYYIVMEYMAGGSLEERLRERGALPVDMAVQVASEVAEGLGCAHEEGVVHCDLKPHNILFDAHGSAKVADFGIAHVSGEMLTRSWMTPAGFVAGTLPYMSPEQAEGVRDDPWVDVYALGAVLYRMLTGQPYLEFDQREDEGSDRKLSHDRWNHSDRKDPNLSFRAALLLGRRSNPQVISRSLLRSVLSPGFGDSGGSDRGVISCASCGDCFTSAALRLAMTGADGHAVTRPVAQTLGIHSRLASQNIGDVIASRPALGAAKQSPVHQS